MFRTTRRKSQIGFVLQRHYLSHNPCPARHLTVCRPQCELALFCTAGLRLPAGAPRIGSVRTSSSWPSATGSPKLALFLFAKAPLLPAGPSQLGLFVQLAPGSSRPARRNWVCLTQSAPRPQPGFSQLALFDAPAHGLEWRNAGYGPRRLGLFGIKSLSRQLALFVPRSSSRLRTTGYCLLALFGTDGTNESMEFLFYWCDWRDSLSQEAGHHS
jgi:hypothetical protein